MSYYYPGELASKAPLFDFVISCIVTLNTVVFIIGVDAELDSGRRIMVLNNYWYQIFKFPVSGFATEREVSKKYGEFGYCLQHNHPFHLCHRPYWVRNRKPTPRREEHIMILMEILGRAREVCGYSQEIFSWLVTLMDMNSFRCRFRLIDRRNDVVRVKAPLRDRGKLRLVKRSSIMEYIFCTAKATFYWQLHCDPAINHDSLSVCRCNRRTAER